MQVNGVSPLDNFSLDKLSGGTETTNLSGPEYFTHVLQQMLGQVEDTQRQADNLTKALLTGGVEDLHQVTFAAEQAKLTLQLAVQVRNKMVDAYQEIMRMQV